jgi:hypothetical protein
MAWVCAVSGLGLMVPIFGVVLLFPMTAYAIAQYAATTAPTAAEAASNRDPFARVAGQAIGILFLYGMVLLGMGVHMLAGRRSLWATRWLAPVLLLLLAPAGTLAGIFGLAAAVGDKIAATSDRHRNAREAPWVVGAVAVVASWSLLAVAMNPEKNLMQRLDVAAFASLACALMGATLIWKGVRWAGAKGRRPHLGSEPAEGSR